MQRTSILKTILLTAAISSSAFSVKADVKSDLRNLNSDMSATLERIQTDRQNQENNPGWRSDVPANYKRKFDGQVKQLENLLAQATNLVNQAGGGRGARRVNAAEDLRIAPMLTNAIANLDRLGQLNELDEDIKASVLAFLQGVNASSNPKLQNQISAATNILMK